MKATRFATLMLGGLVALSGPAWAQEEGEKKKDDGPKLSSTRQREVDRLKRDLGLSDSQSEKLTKIFLDAEAALKKLLTADQKETFESRYNRSGGDRGGRRGRGGFGGFGGAGGMGGMMRGMQERMLSGMTEQLGLNKEQQEQAKKIMEEGAKTMQDAMAKARETGDWGSIRDVMRNGMEEGMKKLEAILDDEQKKKFKEYRDSMQNGMGRWGGRGGDRGGRRGRRGNSVEARLRRILEDLALTDDEKMVLEAQIKAVLEAQQKGREAVDKAREDLRSHMRGDDRTSETIAAKVSGVRTAEKNSKKSVGEAQNALRDLVTMEQEAILLAHGVLE